MYLRVSFVNVVSFIEYFSNVISKNDVKVKDKKNYI